MAFATTTVWEVQTGGSDTLNGGGFDMGNANMATDLKTASGTSASPVMVTASYNFVSAQDVNNWLFIKSGTNWNPGWFKITAVSSNNATVDASTGNWIDLTTYAPSTFQGIVTSSYVSNTASGTWGLDYSQGGAVTLTVTIASTTTFTSTPAVGKNFVGNVLFLSNAGASGATVQRYQVSSTSGTTATVDKTFGVSTGSPTTVTMGGPLGSPGQAGALIVSACKTYIKSGAYSITSASANVSGGCLSPPSLTYYADGYGSLRGDLGTAPVLTASGISSATIITTGGALDCFVKNITVDGASLSSIQGFSCGRGVYYLLTAKNCTNSGIASASTPQLVLCRATGCSTTAAFSIAGGMFVGCVADNNTILGFTSSAATSYIHCAAINNTGATVDGFSIDGRTRTFASCLAYGNGRDGFGTQSATTCVVFTNCLAVNNGGYGFRNNNFSVILANCAGCSNTSGNTLLPTTTFQIFGLLNIFTNLNTGATSAVVSAAGSGYAVGDILTVSGGTSVQTATFKVATLSGSGVATVTLVRPGSYSVTPANAAATTHVTGSGNDACTLTVTYNGDIVFNNAGGNDFSLSNVPGAGGACRQAGIPGATSANKLPGLSTNSYPPIGAAVPVYPLAGGMTGGYGS